MRLKKITKRHLLRSLEEGGWDTRSFERLNITAMLQILKYAPKREPAKDQ